MKIHINRNPGSLACEVFILSGEGNKYQSYLTFGENKVATTNVFERIPGAFLDVKPAFIMEEQEIRELLKAFIEYAKEEGFKTPDESHTKGKLEATESHLKDMRTLLKLK